MQSDLANMRIWFIDQFSIANYGPPLRILMTDQEYGGFSHSIIASRHETGRLISIPILGSGYERYCERRGDMRVGVWKKSSRWQDTTDSIVVNVSK